MEVLDILTNDYEAMASFINGCYKLNKIDVVKKIILANPQCINMLAMKLNLEIQMWYDTSLELFIDIINTDANTIKYLNKSYDCIKYVLDKLLIRTNINLIVQMLNHNSYYIDYMFANRHYSDDILIEICNKILCNNESISTDIFELCLKHDRLKVCQNFMNLVINPDNFSSVIRNILANTKYLELVINYGRERKYILTNYDDMICRTILESRDTATKMLYEYEYESKSTNLDKYLQLACKNKNVRMFSYFINMNGCDLSKLCLKDLSVDMFRSIPDKNMIDWSNAEQFIIDCITNRSYCYARKLIKNLPKCKYNIQSIIHKLETCSITILSCESKEMLLHALAQYILDNTDLYDVNVFFKVFIGNEIVDVIQYFIDAGADIYSSDDVFLYTINLGSSDEILDILKILISNCATISFDNIKSHDDPKFYATLLSFMHDTSKQRNASRVKSANMYKCVS